MPSLSDPISVGSRSSPLSKEQVKEVLLELQTHQPHVRFEIIYVQTIGDINQHISLRTLGKTDFFTKEVDEMVLNHTCRIGIHSAKDLPDPLPKGLKMFALTTGVDSSDSLVFRPSASLESLPKKAKIATSSLRREETVKTLRPDLTFIDLRGTIGQRLQKLETGEADGVVVAEAALIRLGLTHLNRIRLPGETVPFQGQLAILGREDDAEMMELFACIDSRKLA
jgi:hydroxymethylbilane synthase